MIKGIGVMDETLDRAGEEARQDFLRALPPGYVLIRLPARFRPLPPLGRGIAALVTSVVGMITILGGIRWLLNRPS